MSYFVNWRIKIAQVLSLDYLICFALNSFLIIVIINDWTINVPRKLPTTIYFASKTSLKIIFLPSSLYQYIPHFLSWFSIYKVIEIILLATFSSFLMKLFFLGAIQTFEYYFFRVAGHYLYHNDFVFGNYKLQMSQVYYQISYFINLIDPAVNCPPTQELFEFINTLKQAIENNPEKAVINYESLLNIYQKMLSESYFKLENYADFYEIILDTFTTQTDKVNYQTIEIILKFGVLTFSKVTLETQESWSHPANYHSD